MESKLIIPQAEFDRIESDALAWAENQYGHDDVNKDYLEGALHEAMIAQRKIIDLGKELSELKRRCDKIKTALKQFISYHETGLLPDRFTYEKGVEAMKGEVAPEPEPDGCPYCGKEDCTSDHK